MLLANRSQCNQQRSSIVNQMFQLFSPESIASEDTEIIETRKRLWFYFHFCCIKKNICVYIYVYVYIFLLVYKKCSVYICYKYMFHSLNINSCAFLLPGNTTLICKIICKFFPDTFAALAGLWALVLDNDFHDSVGISFLQYPSIISPVSGPSWATNVGQKYTLPMSDSFLSQLWSVSTASVIAFEFCLVW